MRANLAGIVLVLVAVAGCGGEYFADAGDDPPPSTTPPGDPPDADADAVERRMERALFDRLNDERAARDLDPLAWDDELAEAARGWSGSMEQTGVLRHSDRGELAGFADLQPFVALGQNIFRANRLVPVGAVHVGWMGSDRHRHNVLRPGFGRVGIGVVCDDEGNALATQQFGRLAGSERPEIGDEVPPPEPVARPEEDGPSCAG